MLLIRLQIKQSNTECKELNCVQNNHKTAECSYKNQSGSTSISTSVFGFKVTEEPQHWWKENQKEKIQVNKG